MVSQEYKDNIEQHFFLYNVVPRVLRQHLTGFLLVQCCPRSIKTKLNRIFYCKMLSQEDQDKIEQIFFLCNVVLRLLDNIVQGF